MAAVETAPLNGFDSNDAPTPEGVEPQINGDDSDDGDLFGDDNEEEVVERENQRTLDDHELDSGDDEGRADRLANTVEDYDVEEEQKETVMCDVDVAPIRPPEGNELYLLNMPPFIGLNPQNFHYPSYEPPTQAHDASQMKPEEKFSSYSTATSTIYWRRDPNPKNSDTLQSNARIIRWSDGSLTLQLASKPTQQYLVTATALRQNYNTGKNRIAPVPIPYDPNRDTHNYLAAPHITSGLDAQIVRPLDAALRIQKSGDLANESVNRLKAELARAGDVGNPLDTMIKLKTDPEFQRLQAEKAEKDAMRAARVRENAQQRNNARKDGVLGRSGLGRSGGAIGLSIGGLEDDEGMPTSARGAGRGKGRGGAAAAAKRRKTNRHGEIYSDGEDDTLPRGRTREDEYDREDDFLADSEEEPETYEDDEELPEDEDEEGEEDQDAEGEVDEDVGGVVPEQRRPERKERERTPKRPAADDDDDEGEGEGAGRASPGQIRKKRRVIDDEDDDE